MRVMFKRLVVAINGELSVVKQALENEAKWE